MHVLRLFLSYWLLINNDCVNRSCFFMINIIWMCSMMYTMQLYQFYLQNLSGCIKYANNFHKKKKWALRLYAFDCIDLKHGTLPFWCNLLIFIEVRMVSIAIVKIEKRWSHQATATCYIVIFYQESLWQMPHQDWSFRSNRICCD